MKKIIQTGLLLMLGTVIFGQRVDLDRLNFTHRYTRVPDIAVDPEYATYSIHVSKTVSMEYYSNQSVTNMINIEGRKKVDDRGHIQINVTLQDFMIESSNVEERIEEVKDKDGKVTGRNYYFKMVVKYSFSAFATVNDYKGSSIRHFPLAGYNEKKYYSTSEFRTRSEATNFYNNNNLEIKTRLIAEEINKAMTSLNTGLSYTLGYKTMSEGQHLWNLGSKKHEEYEAYNKECNQLKSSLEKITANEIPADVLTSARSSVDYFNAIAQKFNDPEDKGHKKLRYGAYFNLAALYFYAEQFDKAKEYAQMLITNDYDVKDGEKFLKEIEDIQKDFEKHGIPSRHFYRDVQDAMPPQ